MRLSILAKSSSNPDNPYNVDFIKEDGRMKIFCSCPAGSLGQLCKHKIEIIQGNLKRLHNSKDKHKLEELFKILDGTTVLNLVNDYYQKIKDIEERQNDLKKELTVLKHELARKMTQGIVLP
jgi:hypothetical protein